MEFSKRIIFMKKSIIFTTALITAMSIGTSAFAADGAYTLKVSDKAIDLSAIPTVPYKEGSDVMVPLRAVSEGLGYTVGWDESTGEITVEDAYIQKAYLHNGSAEVKFDGKLKIIDMSRTVTNSKETVIIDGYTYVPCYLFTEFLNDVIIEGTEISISPSKVYIDRANGNTETVENTETIIEKSKNVSES